MNHPLQFCEEYASVDAVILFAVLTCIRTNEEQEQLMSEIKRVLRPQGILYVNDFLLNTDERNLSRYERFKEIYGVYGVFELPEGTVLIPKVLVHLLFVHLFLLYLHQFGTMCVTAVHLYTLPINPLEILNSSPYQTIIFQN